MVHPMTHTDLTSRPSPRLRPDSDRALRQLRLVWLLGWRVPDIATWLGVAASTVRRDDPDALLLDVERAIEREGKRGVEARSATPAG